MVLGFSLPERTSVTEYTNHQDYIEFRQALCPLVLYKSMVALTTPFNQKNMQFKLQKANERGTADHGWLKAKHSFSFASYYHPEKMNFGALRVLNDDIIAGGMGFGMHPHDNMEIITIPLEGALEHKDSIGNIGYIEAGDVQVMSAGTGVQHSEFNPSKAEPVRFLQIWIIPDNKKTLPQYQQISVAPSAKLKQWCCIVSNHKQENSILISAAVRMYACILQAEQRIDKQLSSNKAWLQIVSGQIMINDVTLYAGDGAALDNETQLSIQAQQQSEMLLIECHT